MNINNEQRKAFAEIVEANGRSSEFYAKFGKSRVSKNEAKAKALLTKISANDTALDKAKEAQRVEEKAVEDKHRKIKDTIEGVGRTLDHQLNALGYSVGREWIDGSYKPVLREDESITRSEYEMFKKQALADIWGAESLEVAKKAIDRYLKLEK